MFQQMASSCHLGNLKQFRILLKHLVNINQNRPFLMQDSSVHIILKNKNKPLETEGQIECIALWDCAIGMV